MKTKQCSQCGKTKKHSEFAKDKRKPNGVGSPCKSCNHLIDIYETKFRGLKKELINYFRDNDGE